MAVETQQQESLFAQKATRSSRRKQLSPGTHKARSGWFRSREAWPFRETHDLDVEAQRTKFAESCSPVEADWQFAGPSNIGGRVTSLVVHPDDPDLILVGAAGGGIWRSADAGLTWESLWHQEPTLNIGSLAIDPANPRTVYCGTGEANLSADSHPGVGVYVSHDGGSNWQLLAAAATTDIPTRIGSIAVDPFNASHLVIGGVSHAFDDVREGLYRSTDGGVTWSRISAIAAGRYRGHHILFHPTEQNTLYASVFARGTRSGVWRSTDGGASWSQLTDGLPNGSRIFRGALAIAPSDPDRIYAQLADSNGGVLGIYRSDDGGDAWAEISGSHFSPERQMNYNNTIVVHPEDPDHVLCGGVDIHRTRNGGGSWTRVTDWAAERGDADYAHADQHCLVMPTSQPGRIYAANDGGVDLSEDGGGNWLNRSAGLAISMYYDMDIAQSDANMYGGGFQDNGTNITTTGSVDDHFMIAGGDGGWMVIDPTNPLHLYASSQRMRILRFRQPEGWTDVSPLPRSSNERKSMWMVYIAMDPVDSSRVFTGTRRVFRTEDDGDTWSPVSGNLDGGEITAIHVASADHNRIYVGTENGGIFRSIDGGDNWSGDLSGPELPGHLITRIATSPNDADTVFVSVANVGHSHIFRSSDGGFDWEDADGGQLPDVAHHAVAYSVQNSEHLFVAHDLGVAASFDGGSTWHNLTGNLPNQMVIDLVYHFTENRIYVATYGRGIWRLDLDSV